MMNQTGLRRILPDHLSGSCNTFGTPRYPSVKDPILTKRVCFYKSGDLQFNGLRMVINNRTYKTFDALLDSLSKKVPLPFGVRNITTPRGVHAIYTLDELEDGKSYICSDSRKVKPINLALARKKLPPWYHVRPASSRRRTVQQGRFFPGKRINKQGLMLVRTPKRLLVFRNGDPTQKQTVVLRKRTTPTFESILDYISEIMQFHVVKLHTPDGRRVDSLTGLILCSGTVVAAGREPFRSANYNTQKSPTSSRIPTNRASLRRLKSLNRKKMSNLYSSKPRNFSSSSERYIVNRIQSSIAESSCDLPSNLTNSVELESNHMLESVAETDGDVYLGDGAEGQGCMLPSDDDIEKSFRVNQDGSMTVEMKVRLTIKEEETIHWTTTLTRSSVASQLSSNCFPEVEAEQEVCSPESNMMDSQSPASSTDAIDKDKTKDNSDEDPPSLGKGAFSESGNEEDNVKIQTDVVSPRRDPTPGHKQIRKKQVVESIQSMRAEGIQEDMVGSYSYKEHTENGAMTEQYCMVKQSTTRPVPKPRRIGSLDAKNVSTFKSAGVTEILQVESSEDEVTETILHIYEQQTCQDNFLANISGIPFGRPATSETGQFSLNNDIEPELWRPSTASESINIWRPENMSATSDSTFLSLETGAIQATKRQKWVPRPTRGQEKLQQREADKDKNVSSKPKVINKHVRRLLTPGKRQKESSAKATEKKMKTFSSAGFIKKIYGNKSKSIKNPMKRKKRKTQNGDVGFTRKSSLQSDDTIIDPKTPSPQEENSSESVSVETGRLNVSEVSQPRGILARQTSVHQEKKNENKSFDISQNMSVPACISVTNNYVENWLEKAHLNPTSSSEEESKKLEAAALGPTENGICRESEYNHWSAVVAKERKCLQEKSEKQPCPTFKSEQLLDGLSGASVKLRIKCFENKPSNPPMEEIGCSHLSTTNTESCTSVAQNNTEEIKPTVNGITTEIPSDVKVENKSSPINSLQKATLSQMNSMELPPPPSPDELMKLSNNNDCGIDVSSMVSSSLYRLSSVSSQKSESHQMSTSPTSDKAVTSTDHATETPMNDAPSAPLPRTSSVKRVPLISNQALERKMSLRKANVDKYTLCTDATSDTTATSTPINAVCDNDNVLPNGICSTGTQLPAENTQDKTSSSCTSVSPTSLTSGERMSTASILSSQTSTPSDIPLVETKTTKSPFISRNEALSPKPLMKNAQIISSPSPERKTKSKKLSSEESPLHKNHSDKTTSPNIGKRGHATPSASPATERKTTKPRPQQRQSPYSQSLDMASPPVKHRQNKKMLSREISSDNESNTTQRKISPQRKHHQTPQSIKSTTELDKTLTCETLVPEDSQVKKDKVTKTDDLTDVDQKNHVTGTQLMPQPLNISNQPNMKSALEKIYYSIKSIRQITQNKHPSCLEKSNNLPDFSSQVASIFGSSSKALLAFLAVMTLKEEITNFNMDELKANNTSCAEALKMIDSLREIANIKDSQKLQASLINLHQSASKKLLRSWRGFQEFSEKCCSTSNDSQQELSPVDCQEHVIDEIIDNLDIPEKLKEELTSLSVGVKTESDSEENMSTKFLEKMEMSPKNILHRQSTDRPVNVREIIQDRHVNCSIKNNNQDTTDMRKPTDQGITGEDVTDGSSAEDKLNHKITNKNGNMSPEGEMQTQSEESMSIPENEHMSDDESFSKEEGRMFSSANKDVEQNESSRKSVFSSNTSQRHSSEEEQPDVECEEIKQERSDGEDLSNPDSYPEEEDDQKSSSYYAELNVSGNESISSRDENQSLPDTSSEPESLLKSQKEPEIQKSCMGLNISDESTGVSDVDEPVMSGEDQPDGECKELKVIIEECLSETEEEEGIEDEEHLDYVSDHEGEIKKCKEETDDDKEELHIIHGDLRNLIENQVPYTKKDIKRYRFSADEDSGNDHSSCGEQVEVGTEQSKTADEHVRSSTEELSYYEKESSLEEERVNIDKHKRESCKESPALHAQSKLTTSAKAVEKFKHEPEIMLSQSVAERVSLLQKQVEDAQKTKTVKESPAGRRFSQRNIQTEADVDDSPTESPTSQSVLCTRSAPQSSLSFSYDSSGVITTEPEGNRVKSIRDMFLAKSAKDIKQGPKRFQSPKASEQCDLRTETSASGGYQSQTTSELSSGEEDTPRKSIAKGFVRRTIERLYGKKDPLLDEELGERPPSASKQKKKEHSSIFSPFHISRNKTMSELSYFNSSNALDAVTEATRCIAFNAQVGPEDSVPIDNGRWLLRENTLIRKSVSDPVGINKTFAKSPLGEEMCKDTEQSKKSEIGDKKSLSRKCTYFSLPYGSDSELCQDEMSTVTKNSTNADSIIDMKDNSEDTKTWAERNGKLPMVGVTDFKMMDNKVHPLTEAQSGGGVVIAQPQKGQGVVNRRIQFQEPDMLDVLYNFCGQNCPIL